MHNCAGSGSASMAPMDKALFSGEGAIEGADLGKLQVLNSEEAVDAALKNFGWNGRNPAGCAILNLSADNMSATGGQFAAREPGQGGGED